jgi:arylsulfatase A-like enzyme
MSFLGHQFAKTPVMDSMAANGAYLKNALVTTSLCSPSRASILTGLYTFRHRVIDNNRPSRRARSISRNTCRRPATRPASSASGTWAGKATARSPAGTTG